MVAVIFGFVLMAASALLALFTVLGVHGESSWRRLGAKPPTPLAGFSRRLLGVHVRKEIRPDRSEADPEASPRATSLGRR
jgi:hypothetical protein